MLVLALALAACGGPSSTASQASAEGGAQSEGGERSREHERRDEDDELPLDAPVTIAGTGIQLRPPRGSQRAVIRTTFVHPRRRIQLMLWAADGDLTEHQNFRTGLRANAEELESEDLTVDGAPALYVVDLLEQGETELERVWVLARRGTRSVAAMGLYPASRSDRLRPLVRASLMSLDFDEAVPLDPEAALGWRMPALEGLQLVRTTSTNLSYSLDGSPPSAGSLDPVMVLMPLPIEVPEAQRSEICTNVLTQILQIPEERVADRSTLRRESLVGCDVAATSADQPPVLAYFALVFRGPGAFLVQATVGASEREPWLGRFRNAASSLESTAPPEAAPSGTGETEEDEGADLLESELRRASESGNPPTGERDEDEPATDPRPRRRGPVDEGIGED